MSRPIILIVVALVVGIIILSLIPTILGDASLAFQFADNESRNPIFATGLGRLVPLIMGFIPVVLFVGLLAVGFVYWNRSRGS